MKLKAIGESLKVGADILKHNIKKASPSLLIGGGIALAIGAVVVACIESQNVEEAVKEEAAEIQDIRIQHEAAEEPDPTYAKRLVIAYSKVLWKLVKNYKKTLILLFLSILMTLSGHNMLQDRVATYFTAAAASQQAFENYRKNVIKDLGEEADRRFNGGLVPVETTDESGNPTTVEVPLPTASTDILFDVGSIPSWYGTNSIVEYLQAKQDELNAKIMRRFKYLKTPYSAPIVLQEGYLMWTEFAEAMGHNVTAEERKTNACMGIVYTGDPNDLLDFGIWDRHTTDPSLLNFLQGFEDCVLLTPNFKPII